MMELAQALSLPLGRSVALSPETTTPLLGPAGTLFQQSQPLLKAVQLYISQWLHEPLPLRRASGGALLLTEHEHPAWAILALSSPPVLTEQQTLSALQAQLNLQSPTQAIPNWATWLAYTLLSTVQPLFFSCWGVLLPWACLQQQQPQRPEVAWLSAELLAQPQLLHDPQALALRVMWGVWSLAHGGQPLTDLSGPELAQMTRSTVSLRERTTYGPLPSAAELRGLLQHWLPSLDKQAQQELLKQMGGDLPINEKYLTGIEIIRRPGEVALWRRNRSAVQLVVLSSAHSPLPMAWEWSVGQEE